MVGTSLYNNNNNDGFVKHIFRMTPTQCAKIVERS